MFSKTERDYLSGEYIPSIEHKRVSSKILYSHYLDFTIWDMMTMIGSINKIQIKIISPLMMKMISKSTYSLLNERNVYQS